MSRSKSHYATPDDWSGYEPCKTCGAGYDRPCRALPATRTWPTTGTTVTWQPRGLAADRVLQRPHPGRRKTDPYAAARARRDAARWR